MEQLSRSRQSRRSFLSQSVTKTLGLVLTANASVYAVGAVFNIKDGKLSAGAKSCAPGHFDGEFCPMGCGSGPSFYIPGMYSCDTWTGTWQCVPCGTCGNSSCD